MVNKKIKEELKELYIKKYFLVDEIDKEIKNKVKELEDSCDHKNELGKPTIEYDDNYEMRSSDMHCTQCGKEGSRNELS